MHHHRFARTILATGILVGLTGVLTGCGSDSDSSSTTTTPKEAVCADKAELEDSVSSLRDVDLTGGKDAVTNAVDKVKDNLDALRTSVQADLRPEVDDVKDALTELQTTVGNLGDGSITKNLESIGTAISKVGSSAGTLFSSLQTECS